MLVASFGEVDGWFHPVIGWNGAEFPQAGLFAEAAEAVAEAARICDRLRGELRGIEPKPREGFRRRI